MNKSIEKPSPQSKGLTAGHVVVAVIAAAAVANIFTLRQRLLTIERMHSAVNEAHKQRQRMRTAQDEYIRTQRRAERSRGAEEEAQEEMRRQARYQRMRAEEEKERDRFRRAYARWQKQSKQEEGGGQQYWDGQSYGHGWDPREEEAERERAFRGGGGGGAGLGRGLGRGSDQHWHALGLDRRRREPFSAEEIKAAFRTKAMELHPDRNPERPAEAAALFKRALDAYHALRPQGSHQ